MSSMKWCTRCRSEQPAATFQEVKKQGCGNFKFKWCLRCVTRARPQMENLNEKKKEKKLKALSGVRSLVLDAQAVPKPFA
jgi:hypothetical protein